MVEILTSIMGRRVGLDEDDNLVVKGEIIGPAGWFDVKRFGAVGDGTTNDGPAIREAIAAALPTNGVVWFPVGWYNHDGFDIGAAGSYNQVKLVGENVFAHYTDTTLSASKGVILYLRDGSNRDSITVPASDASDVGPAPLQIEDIWIHGNQANNTGTSYGVRFTPHTLTANKARSGFLRRCRITNCRSGGVHSGTNRNAGYLDSCVILNCGVSGVVANALTLNSCADWRIMGGDYGVCTGAGWRIAGGVAHVFTGANTFNNTNNVYVDGAYGWNVFQGCSIDRCEQHAVRVSGATAGGTLMFGNCHIGLNSMEATGTYSDFHLTDVVNTVSVMNSTFALGGATRSRYHFELVGTTQAVIAIGNTYEPGASSLGIANDDSRLIRSDYPRGYISGLGLANDTTDATNDLTVSIGACRDDTDGRSLQTISTIVKQIDVDFAEYVAPGTASGGRDPTTNLTGAKGFHVFLIGGAGKSAQPFFATSLTPTLPAGFTSKRRIGWVYWTGSAIKPFTQTGDLFEYAGGVPDLNGTSWTSTAATQLLTVPIGIKVEAILWLSFTPATAGAQFARVEPLTTTDTAVTATRANVSTVTGTVAGCGSARVITNTSGQIRRRSSDASGSTVGYITTMGWVDRRGKDD